MSSYLLAKIVEWSGGMESRKRIQKTIALLQSAGLQIEAEFYVHRHGPYSTDVARPIDAMVRCGLLAETEHDSGEGQRYSYELTARGCCELVAYERGAAGRAAVERLQQIEPIVRELARTEIDLLELAATIAYFRMRGDGWGGSRERASQMKGHRYDDDRLRVAEVLARRVRGQLAYRLQPAMEVECGFAG